MENDSRRYNSEKVKQMIERQKAKYGWEFLFLGANIDAVETVSYTHLDVYKRQVLGAVLINVCYNLIYFNKVKKIAKLLSEEKPQEYICLLYTSTLLPLHSKPH